MFAAIDIGSNSFHLILARIQQNEVRLLEKRGEKVQLGAGLDANNQLDEASQERALQCLKRFRERVGEMPAGRVLVVGTNALREATNAQTFIRKAQAVIGHPISIISGREEARLIYLGVAHSLADDSGNRLVIDIGGGSTEFIIGERFEPKILESLDMGCVSYRDRFFANGEITAKAMQQAILEASREVLGIRHRYRQVSWSQAVGSSGTIKAVQSVLQSNGWDDGKIRKESLEKLCDEVIRLGKASALSGLGVRSDRLTVFAGGLAILRAAFNVLEIEQMEFCDGALREGLLYDMIGRNSHEDVRERTIQSLQSRYHIDQTQAEAVENTALRLWHQIALEWSIDSHENELMLRWGARLHEIGLAIAHNQYHKHGAYLLQHSDMAGFNRQMQEDLSILVLCHRRKLSNNLPQGLAPERQETLLRLSVILRLAVVLNHSRSTDLPSDLILTLKKEKTLNLSFGNQWVASHPLSKADLQAEAQYLGKVGIELQFSDLGD